MNVVDSSAWLEFFTGGKNADYFLEPIKRKDTLIVPSICILELGKKVLRERGEDAWLTIRGVLEGGSVVPLDAPLAALAAELAVQHRLPLAESIIYATTLAFDATLWTQDADFRGLPSVKYKAK